MPVLAILSLILDTANRFVKLMQKPELCAHTEVGDSKETKFFKDKFTGELNLDGSRRQKVLEGQWRYLHYVADVETVNPFVLVQVPKDVLHVGVANVYSHAATKPLIRLFLSNLNQVVCIYLPACLK